MCVAIFKKAGAELSKEDLEACFEANDDGAGFAVACKDEAGKPLLYTKKGFFSFKEFWDAWSAWDFKEHNAVVHFRVATHGGRTADNTHPFVFKQGDHSYALIHNGVLSEFTYDTDRLKKSDSRLFTERVIAPLAKKAPDFINNGMLVNLLSAMVGSNKLVMLREDGNWCILNAKDGTWRGDVWFSNTFWEGRKNWRAEQHKRVADRSGYGPRDTPTFNEWLQERADDTAAACDTSGCAPGDDARGEWWSQGFDAAEEGFKFNPATHTEWWCRGFLDHVEKLKNDPVWLQGFKDHMTGLAMATFDSEKQQKLYRSGYLWSEYQEDGDRAVSDAEMRDRDKLLSEWRIKFEAEHPKAEAKDFIVYEHGAWCHPQGNEMTACGKCRAKPIEGNLVKPANKAAIN